MTLRKAIVYGILLILFMVVVGFLWAIGVQGYMIALLSGGLLFVQYFFSDRLVLWSTGARILEEGEEPGLQNMVAGLATEMGLPKPKVAIVQNDAPNAFATGRNKSHAVVAVTTGIMGKLNDNEMKGVLAHELSHVRNRDMFVITFASFLVSILSYIIYIAINMMFSRNSRDGESFGASLMAWYISMIVSNTIGTILVNTVSRYREYGADRGSALATKNPDWLISALRKISGGELRTEDAVGLSSARALCIAPIGGSILELFSTHPPVEKRIAQLERIKAEMYGY